MEAFENQEQVKDTTLATGIPRIRIPLEVSDSVCGNGASARKKRDSGHLEQTKTSSTRETIPGNESHKRSRDGYELRPRHKTREDRYEYKGPSSAVEAQSQSRKGRAKKSRGRRHTMNDDFQAINVTGNRLTLRNNTNLGIFGKGRSSSTANTTSHHGNTLSTALAKPAASIKSHKYLAESDLAFSEMNFLFRRRNLSPYPTSTARETFNGQHEREYHPQEQQFEDPARDFTLDMAHSNNKLLGGKHQLDTSVTPLFTSEEAPVSEISPVSNHSRSASPKPRNKRRKTSKQASSIPYTWSETVVDGAEQSHALEQHLLNLLHVGVHPEVLCSEITNTVSAKRYWTLAELCVLLEERKTSWSNDAANKKRTSPESNMGQLAAAEAETALQVVPEIIASDHLDLDDIGCAQNEKSKQSPGSTVACETACSVKNDLPQQSSILEQQQEEPRQTSDNPGYPKPQATTTSNNQYGFIDILDKDQCELFSQQSADDDVIFPVSVPEVKRPHMSDIEFYELGRVEDDDVFYRTLDAAYSAIVRPEVAAEVASDLQHSLESPELNSTDLPNSPESTGIRDSDIPTKQVEAGETEPLATVSQDIIQEQYDESSPEPYCQHELPTSHSNDPCVDQSNDLPWLTTGYGQSQPHASAGIDARQSQPPRLSRFWRQNKLY
ncbi:hypothetical protein PENVUL_c007G01504 [Penicillium vulpinum]|uniref:Uncharacterized protein n=1 Tax=Penicillium vulpinum TaxID=29845 RepID=A0A1V6S6C2_9EURO|nr:hypothetical protein PENVUL_c007G01504 [Penicillium vulpinum]